MKPENKFRGWFLERFATYMKLRYPSAKVTVQKHADYATTGIADISLSINGMTAWYEIKLLTSCKEERKLHATPIQRAFLESRAEAGVPSGLLVGLALGPRKGYKVALFIPPISEVVHRDMFRSVEEVSQRIYSLAATATRYAAEAFERETAPQFDPVDFSELDTHLDLGSDDAVDDGG